MQVYYDADTNLGLIIKSHLGNFSDFVIYFRYPSNKIIVQIGSQRDETIAISK